MAKWLNHVTIAAPRNGTATHTVSPASGTVAAGALFTPTAGRLLVVVVEGAVTSTTPTGWTLPTGGSAINNTGLYVWSKTAAGSDSLATTHNGSNYPVVFDFYEFASGSTFVKAASATGTAYNGGAGPTLTGLTGTNLIFGAMGQANASASTTWSTTWASGVEAVDTTVGLSGTDGYAYSATYLEDSALTSSSIAATTDHNDPSAVERLMFAVNVASGSTLQTGTATAAGTGATTAAGVLGKVIAATLASTAVLTAGGVVGGSQQAALTGTGAATASGSVVSSGAGAAAITGTGSLTAAGTVGKTGTSTSVTGTGSVTAAGTVGKTSSASVAASGVITATGAVISGSSGAADVLGTVTVTASGRTGLSSPASISGVGQIRASGSINTSATSTLAGTGTVTATGVVHGQNRDITIHLTGPTSRTVGLALRDTTWSLTGPTATDIGLSGPHENGD